MGLMLASKYRISLVIRWSFSFQNSPKNLDPSYKVDLESFGLFRKDKTHIMAKFQRTDSVICCHSSEGGNPVLEPNKYGTTAIKF